MKFITGFKNRYKIISVLVLFAMLITNVSFGEINAYAVTNSTEVIFVAEYNCLTGTETVYAIEVPDQGYDSMSGIQSNGLNNTVSPYVVVPPDNSSLVDVSQYDIYPQSSVCRLYAGGLSTAFLVGPKVALTAAHCVFDQEEGVWDTNNFVWPNADPEANSIDIIRNGTKVVKMIIPTGYRNSSASGSVVDTDWAILVLADDVGTENGTFGLTVTSPAYEADAFVLGYNSDNMMSFAPGYILNVNSGNVRYTCDTTGGMSGAPVYKYVYSGGLKYNVFAIHSGGVEGSYNHGARINRFIIKKVSDLNETL